jgi:hypothetical protein
MISLAIRVDGAEKAMNDKTDTLVTAVEDESIIRAIARWAEGKSREECTRRAVHLVKPLVGNDYARMHEATIKEMGERGQG